MSLANKHVLVTGAAGSLGQAVCETAKKQGATVIGFDIVKTDSIPHTDIYHSVDLLDIATTSSRIGAIEKVDVLVNTTGGFTMGSHSADAADDQWNLMFKLNVETLRNAVKSVVPKMKEQGSGSIINIGAYGALAGLADMGAYCASKSTVMNLTQSMSEELKHAGINVNAVLPTIIDTQPNRQAMPEANFEEWVSPKELSNVICFLASESAKAIHGALIPVKGLI